MTNRRVMILARDKRLYYLVQRTVNPDTSAEGDIPAERNHH